MSQAIAFVDTLERAAEDELGPGDLEQFKVLMEAFREYLDKNRKYRDLWKDGGATDSIRHLKHKADRAELATERLSRVDPTLFVEDAIDAVNYAVFFIRNVRDGRVG